MKLLFSVYDGAVKYFRDPFVSVSKGDALSQFMAGANAKDSWVSERPQDFSLFILGQFDEVTGQFNMYTSPECLGIALEFVRAKDDVDRIDYSRVLKDGSHPEIGS